MKWFVDFRDVENKRYDAVVIEGETVEEVKEKFKKRFPKDRIIGVPEKWNYEK